MNISKKIWEKYNWTNGPIIKKIYKSQIDLYLTQEDFHPVRFKKKY